MLCYTFLSLVTHWTSRCSAPVWYIDTSTVTTTLDIYRSQKQTTGKQSCAVLLHYMRFPHRKACVKVMRQKFNTASPHFGLGELWHCAVPPDLWFTLYLWIQHGWLNSGRRKTDGSCFTFSFKHTIQRLCERNYNIVRITKKTKKHMQLPIYYSNAILLFSKDTFNWLTVTDVIMLQNIYLSMKESRTKFMKTFKQHNCFQQ